MKQHVQVIDITIMQHHHANLAVIVVLNVHHHRIVHYVIV
jgi:hypothetical protein